MTLEKPIDCENPVISVVVPTIPANSHAEVTRCLRQQTFDRFEVILVNDDCLDICEARNEGIRIARGSVVALTDDDCRPPSDWLERIQQKFAANPELVCLEGAVSGGRTYDGTRKYVGCNLSFDRETALAVGGFRSEYAGWRDDTEFGWRMERDGQGRCEFDKTVRMNHPPRPRAVIQPRLERLLRAEYPAQYAEVVVPDTLIGRVNDRLWRMGFWRAVDRLRELWRRG